MKKKKERKERQRSVPTIRPNLSQSLQKSTTPKQKTEKEFSVTKSTQNTENHRGIACSKGEIAKS